MALFYYKYNNYNNRRLKREDTLEGYESYLVYTEVNPNFNPGDGVNTQITVGRDQNVFASDADYVIYSKTGTEITSRWFVMESHFNRSGQYILNLYRDVVADFYDSITSADTFIEKATLSDSSPFIFNKENISVNQIKKKEYLIKDQNGVGCAWIVGYIARNYEGGEIALTSTDIVSDYTVDSLTNWTYNKYTTTPCYNTRSSVKFNCEFLTQLPYQSSNVYVNLQDWNVNISTTHDTSYASTSPMVANYNKLSDFIENNKATINTTVGNYAGLYETVVSNASDYNSLLSMEGKILYVSGTNTYYKIHTTIEASVTKKSNVTTNKQGEYLMGYLNAMFGGLRWSGSGYPVYQLEYTYNTVTVTLEDMGALEGTHSITMPTSAQRLHVKDAPFDMFCIPFADVKIKNSAKSDFTTFDMTAAGALSLATSLATGLNTNLYDLQLLPFSPLTGLKYESFGRIIDINSSDTKRYTLVDGTLPLIWCTASSGSKTVVNPKIGLHNRKLDNETTFLRFVSPNYSSAFEINPAKLDHGIVSINIDYTYLPYSPFIRVAPAFSKLYGQEFHDARGLILSGDFSLMYTSDAWVNFQVQNKNYDLIFNREVKNLETQYEIANQNAIVGSVVGTLQGAVTGGTIGSMGGPIGTAAGAIAGGLASGIAGAVDIANTKKLQAEAIDFKRDLFGYQLGNIKAMPNSIAKTTAYNIINKIFPVIEVYDCTNEEKLAVANKIAWNGMTVMAIGKIYDYIPNSWSYDNITDKGYIKGQIIRLEGEIDDAHLQATIIEEINKGWYFK